MTAQTTKVKELVTQKQRGLFQVAIETHDSEFAENTLMGQFFVLLKELSREDLDATSLELAVNTFNERLKQAGLIFNNGNIRDSAGISEFLTKVYALENGHPITSENKYLIPHAIYDIMQKVRHEADGLQRIFAPTTP